MRYLIPMASRDGMFPRKEYHFPKPLIEIRNTPMVELVVSAIRSHDPEASFIFVINREDAVEFSLDKTLEFCAGPNCTVVQLERPTKGALCSCLMAIEYINDDLPLVVVNGDQVIDANISDVVSSFKKRQAGAGVITFSSVHPRWSYVKLDEEGAVIQAAEKRVISRNAIAGFYYYQAGRDFISAAKSVILNAQGVNGVYYISPTINQIILAGKTVLNYEIQEAQYHSFYSPQRVEYYEKLTLSSGQRANSVAAEEVRPLQVVIPMAGMGSRFVEAGYKKPKPFIDVLGKTMIERVMDNLRIQNSRFILIAREAHLEAEPEVRQELEALGNIKFSELSKLTEGAACTVLTARGLLDPDAPLLTANCDQIVDFDCQSFIQDAKNRDLDGSILVFRDPARDPKWSFARTNSDGFVEEVREKVAISDMATVGLYYFRRADDYIKAAIDMISVNDRVNNEFYVAPVYNYMIKSGLKIGVYFVPPTAMHGTGTPRDLDAYIEQLKLPA